MSRKHIKLEFFQKDEPFSVRIVGRITPRQKTWLKDLFDHAWLKKTDVSYNQADGELVIRFKRYAEKTKARKKILGLVIWRNSIPPTIDSLLTIKDIEEYHIRDDDPENPKRETVITGGVVIDNNEIYIGAFCEHENPYGITMKVKQINITFEDI